jgi:hypothetical protein
MLSAFLVGHQRSATPLGAQTEIRVPGRAANIYPLKFLVVAAAVTGGRKLELIEILPPLTAAATTAFDKSVPVPFSGRPFPKRGINSVTTILFIAL